MNRAVRSDLSGGRHPWSDEQLVTYLLGELPEAEMEAVDAHLKDCEACREALARLDDVYVASVEELPGDEPAESMWRGIDARVRGTESARRPEPAPTAPATTATPRSSRRPNPRSSPRSSTPGAARPPRSPSSWALSAALVALVVAGGWGAWQRQLVTQARAEVTTLEARVELLEGVVGTVEARADAMQGDQARLANWLVREAVTIAPLSAADDVAPGSVLFQADGRALVVMRDLPGEGRDFQAWGVRDGEVTSLGAFEGRTVEVDVGTYEAVAVSLEPDGGSPTPTDVLGSAEAG